MAAQPAAVLVPYRDADGKQICTTLPDGTRLRWRQMVSSNQKDFRISKTNTTSTYFTKSISADFIEQHLIYYNANVDASGLTNYVKTYYQHVSMPYNTYSQLGQVTKILTTTDRLLLQTMCSDKSDTGTILYSNFQTIDITVLFEHCQSFTTDNTSAFKSMFWSEGTESDKQLGYTPYTAEPTEVVVKDGKLWYLQ